MHDKPTRVLYLLHQLLGGKVVDKTDILSLFEIDNRTFERDIATLRKYLDQNLPGQASLDIIYDHNQKGYTLDKNVKVSLTAKDVIALIKLMLGSRAFIQTELDELIENLVCPLEINEQKQIHSFIGNDKIHFTSLQHGDYLKDKIWDFSVAIEEAKCMTIQYKKANNSISHYKVSPVGLVFSDYYFYVVCYVWGRDLTYPISYRLDRILSYESLSEHFKIPYSKRFESGDFKNKINMMYQGELVTFTFRFTGHSIEAVLDKFPLSKIIEQGEGYCIIEATSYDQGLMMWLLSQGEWVQVLSPDNLVNKIKQKLEKMLKLY